MESTTSGFRTAPGEPICGDIAAAWFGSGRKEQILMMRAQGEKTSKSKEGKDGRSRPQRSFAFNLSSPARGFTLIELLVVMMIITLVIAVVIPKVGSNWKQIQDSDFLQQFTEAIERARLLAMNSGLPVSFRLNGISRVYGCENPPDQPIPLNVEIYAKHLEQDPKTGDFIITFYPDGSFVGDNLQVVFGNSRTYDVHINPLFGTVRVERK
ncbi:MAG: type II secretion system GspH family protein [Deltaproteobacteria bacterium]|nr:type II secretion system GspH family protein [Deltaproteobacteria bacterium]MDA8308301.1 type II secretion system protein [Deltaproteobacteria bacterium]